LGVRAGPSSRSIVRDPVRRRRWGAAALQAFVVFSGLQCVQDLVVAPPRVEHQFSVSPDSITLPIVGPQGRDTLPFTATLTADGKLVGHSLGFTVLSGGENVVRVDSVGRLLVLGRGQARLQVRPRNVALPDTLADTVRITGVVPRIGLETARSVDTLASLNDTLVLRAVALTGRGDTIPGVPIVWQQVSGQGAVSLLDATAGRVRADSNGVAVFRATVDFVDTVRTVQVRQRPASIAVAPDTLLFRYTGQVKNATAEVRDARRNAIAGAVPSWTTSDTAVAIVPAAGQVRAGRDGTAQVSVSFSRDGATATGTVVARVRRARVSIASGDNQTGTVTGPLGAPLVVQLVDSLGTVQEAGVTVTFQVAGGGAHFGGPTDTLLTDTMMQTDAQGRASVTPRLGRNAGAATISVSGQGLIGAAATFTATGAPAPASLVEFRTQPTSRTAGVAFAPALEVVLRDPLGNIATTTTRDVTLAITPATNPGGAVLVGTATVTSASGVASFAGLRILKAGAGYTLTSSASSLPSVASSSFDIATGPPATIALTPASAAIAAGGTAAFTADARDSVGNAIVSGALRWSSLNPKVATVDSATGTATGVRSGQATVVATAGGVTTYALVTVSATGAAPVNLWVATPSGTTGQLNDAWGSAATDVFAVGADGALVRFNGTAWAAMSGAAANDTLLGVWGSSASDVFAVGRHGRLLHHTGSGGWAAMTGIDPSDHLNAVWGSSPRDVFAAGETGGGSGVVYHYDGAAWSKMTVPAVGALRALWGFSANDVHASGAGGVVLHYDGTTWTVALATRSDREGWRLWGSAPNALFGTAITWPGRKLVVRRYDGASWVETVTSIDAYQSGLWGASAAEAYVGTDSSGPFVRFDGSVWAVMPGARGTPMRGVWGTSDGAAWMVGQGGATYRGVRGATVAVAPTTVGLAALGRTQQLTATVRDGAGTVLGGVPVAWSSSDTTRVRVDAAGLVTAVATGSATVTATAQGGASAGAPATVNPIAVSLTVSPLSGSIPTTGGTQVLVVTAHDSAGARVLGRQPVWTSVIPQVATVAATADTTARVTGVGAGQTGIRAELDGLRADAFTTASATGLQPVNVWQTVRPASDTALASVNFYAAWGTSDSNLVVVGDRSFRFDGSAWHQITELTGVTAIGVGGVSAPRMWAVGTAGSLYAYDGSTWTSVNGGTSNTLYGVWGTSDRNVFVGGANATMLHFDGSAWSSMTTAGSPTAQLGLGLWGSSHSDVWTPGAANAMLHYDGSAWSVVGVTGRYLAIWGDAANDVFAVGTTGAILRYNGSAWSAMTSPTLQNLSRVWGAAANDVYAVGSSGTVLRFDGGSWASVPTFMGARSFQGVWGTPQGSVWAVGGGSGPGFVLRGYRGGTVTVAPSSAVLHSLGATASPTATVRDAGGRTLSDVALRWTSDDPTIARVDTLTGVVTAVRNGTTTVRATAAGGASAAVSVTVLQVSKTLSITPRAVVLGGAGATQSFSATAQDSLNNPIASPTLTWTSPSPGIATISASGVATAVGSGQVVVSATDGGATAQALLTVTIPVAAPVNLWASMTSGTTGSLLGVWGTTLSDIYAAGSTAILRFNGSAWNMVASGLTQAMQAIWGSSSTDIFAVGSTGSILHSDGAAWTPMTSGTTQTLVAIWGTSRSDVFAAGGGGTILHYDGAAWAAMNSGTTQTLRAIWGTSPTDVFAVGTTGTVLHYDGTTWSPMASGTTLSLMDVWGTSGADVYALASTGAFFRFNGTSWSALTSAATSLRQLSGSSTSDLYAIGTSGAIRRWDGAAWSTMASGTVSSLLAVWAAPGGEVYATGSAGTVLRGLRGATVELTAPGWSVTSQGTQQQLTATARDASLAVVGGVAFAWTSSNPAVATVDGAGLVTAADTGSTQVIATAPGGAADTVTLTVSLLANTVTLTPSGAALSGLGATQTLTAEVRDASGNVVPSPSVTWTSLKPAVATVDAAGVVTATGVGQASIVATSGALTGYVVVTVTTPGLPPVNLWAPMASGTVSGLKDVWGTSGNDVWAVGDSTALVLHYDGTQWRSELSGIAGVTDYWGISVGGTAANDVLVGTSLRLLVRYDGISWTTITPPAEYGSGNPAAVWAASPRETYVGMTGALARWNQSSWTRLAGVTSATRLWGSATGDVIATGTAGTIWRCRAGACTGSATPSGVNAIRGIWGADSSSVLAVGGGSGYVISYDGSAWSQLTGVPAAGLNGVTGSAPSDVYAVGNAGAIVRYDGIAWTTQSSGTASNLTQAWTSPAGNVYVVGDGGTILRGMRSATVTVSAPNSTPIGIGAGRQLTATAFAGGLAQPGVPFGWTSSDTTVARVLATTGVVTGVAAGTATITATAPGGASGTLVVTVSTSAATVASVSVSPANPTLTGYGATQALVATARDASNDVVSGVTFTWSTGNAAVATVNAASGLVTGVHVGTATITAAAAGSGVTGSVTVTVAPAATSTVTVTPAGTALSGVGSTQALAVQVRDPQGDVVASPSVTWTSLNPLVATVDPATGVVTAVAPGQVTIAATSGGGTGSALVTVAAPVAAPVTLWVPMTTGTATSSSAVWGTSPTDVWAVSSNATTALHYDGTAWTTTTLPLSFGTTGVWGTSSSDVFAVGGGGSIVRFDGTAWSTMASGTAQSLQDVWGSSHTDVFAVGTGGTIVHYDGTAWSAMTSGTGTTLNAVWGTSRANVWAVGQSGTILHYDGTTWSPVTSGTPQLLNDVWGLSATEVYAVGNGGTILRWTGASWGAMTSGTTQSLTDVWGTSGADIYAVGGNGTVVRYDGATWRSATVGTAASLLGAWGAGIGDVFASVGPVTGGTSAMLRGVRGATLAAVGGTWGVTAAGNQQQLTATARDAGNNVLAGVPFTWTSLNNSIATVNASGLVTAVGLGTANIVAAAPGGLADTVTVTVTLVANTVTVVPMSVFLNGIGATWSLAVQVRDASGNLVVSPVVTWTSRNPAVATVDAATGLVTAVETGQATIVATSGGTTGTALVTVTAVAPTPVNLWAPVTSGTTQTLLGTWGASASDVFAVGGGGNILHFDGSAWTLMASGTTQSLQDVWGTSGTDVFVVGSGGTILRYTGTGWAPMTSGTTQQLLGVWGASRSDVFAVGANGTILRYDGTSWNPMASGTSQQLFAVWGASRTNVFAVGNAGTILHYDGTGWSPMTSGTTQALQDVWGTSATDVFVTATGNFYLHYNGSAWSTVTTPSVFTYGVWGTASSDVFEVGSGGTAQHYDGSTWTPMSSGTIQSLQEVWTTAHSDVTVVGNSGTILRGVRGATVTIAAGSWTVTPQGNQQQLTATVRDGASAVVPGVALAWRSVNPAVAAVNGSGLVTAVALGSADIVATAPGGLADTLTVAVTLVANTVKVTPAGVTLTGAGSAQTLAVEVRDGSGSVVPSPTVAWTSLNPAVATVNGSGQVTAVAAGQTAIAATSGAVTSYATVTVNVPGAPPVNLWAPATGPPVSYLYGLWGSSPTNVYAASGSNVLYRYNGAVWATVNTASSFGLQAVWGSSAADVFAVGYNGAIVHYDGSAWAATPSGTGQTLAAIWGASRADVFAVGYGGTILHYDGAAWSTMASGTTRNLYGVWGTSRSDVFAVGDQGTFLHYDGNAWTAMPGTQTWWYPRAVWGTSGTDVFAAGGGIYHYDGATWTDAGVSLPNTANGIWGTSHSDIYAVGYNGTYARFDGSTWTAGTGASLPSFNGLWSTGSSDLLAVGSGVSSGAVARGVRSATVTVTAGGWTISAQGNHQQLTATARDASSAVLSGVPFTWTSSNQAVATVNGSGLVTAVSLGTTTVTATAAGGASGSILVTVSLVANSVTVSPLGAAVAGVGTTQAFTVEVRDGLGNLVPNPPVTWASLNPTVATVNPTTGLATTVSAGQATIAVTSDAVTAYALLTVAAPVATPVNLWAPTASGTTADVTGVWAASGSDAFAVTSSGGILHYNGATWGPMTSPSSYGLNDVWGASGTDVFAVGGGGTILRYNGTNWSPMTSGTSQWLYDVWGASGSDVFAVGNGGTILHFDGTTWNAMTSGTSQALQAVWGVSRSNVFVVGYNGTVLHFDGTTWSPMAGDPFAYYSDVWGTSGSDVYAVGGNNVLHYDGSTWSALSGSAWATAIAGNAPSELYTLQSTSIYAYNGSVWTATSTPSGLSAIWSSQSDVFVVGPSGAIYRGVRGASVTVTTGSWAVTAQGNQQQLTGTARDAANNVLPGVPFNWTSSNPSVATVSASGLVTATGLGSANIIAAAIGGLADTVSVTVTLVANTVTVTPAGATVNGVGATRTFAAQVRDGAGNLVPSPVVTWSSLNPSVATVNAATGVATGVAVGQATIVATSGGMTGTALVTVTAAAATPVNLWAAAVTGTLGSYQQMYGVWGASPTDVFVGGSSGLVWHFNGTSWSSTSTGTYQDLRGVWGTSGSDVFVAGGGGTILRYNGTSWTPMSSGSSVYLYSVWGSSGKDVYAVGEYGTILHYDGTGWSAVPGIQSSFHFQSVWGTSRADVYAASGNGVMHFDGTSWSTVAAVSWAYGVWGTSSSDVYAASYNVLRFNGSTWTAMAGSTGWAQALWGSSASELYAVRGAGEISAWNGTTWSPFVGVSDRDLQSVWGTATSDVYATGTNWSISSGVILRGVRGATVTVSPAAPTLTGLGTTRQLSAAAFAGGNAVSGATFTWTSSNAAVATVNALGLVTAVGAGAATITATAAGGANASTVVTVSP